MSTTIGATTATTVSKTTTVSTDGGVRIISEMPESTAFAPPSTSGIYPLRSYDVQITGGKKTVTANYTKRPGRDPGPVGTVTRDSDGTAQELPIRSHPLCSNPLELDEAPIINGVAKDGVQSYLVPGVIYRYSEVKSSASWTQSNLVSGVGQLSTPTGMTGETTDSWLKTGRTVGESGEGTVITDTWQYAPEGWDTDIYS